jgi:hypothetical protein
MTSDAGSRTSNYVYIMSDEYAWLPGRVVDYTQTRSGDGTTAKDVLQANVSVPFFKNEDAIQSGPQSSSSSARGKATIHTVKLAAYPSRSLPLQNVDEEGRLQEVEDMVDLPFLHEVSDTGFILRVLVQRP